MNTQTKELEARKETMMKLRAKIFHMQTSGSRIAEVKGYKDYITPTDREIEQILRREITTNFPHDAIVGEEFAETNGTSGFCWYLDPIDGTKNFMKGSTEYGTSIGVVYQKSIVLGIIFYARDQKAYWAIEGKGAWCDDTKIHVSKATTLKDSLIAVMIHRELSKAKHDFETLHAILPRIAGIRMIGSCVGCMIHVANGTFDAYWAQEYLSSHDFCAGALIVKEAGGFVSHEDGTQFITPKQGHCFASNGQLHTEFVELISTYYFKK